MPTDLQQHSMEDARLYEHQDSLWMVWTVSQYPAVQFRCITVFGQLVQDATGWTVGQHFAPQHGKNDFSALEKNWASFSFNGHIVCCYSTTEDVQTFLQVNNTGNIAAVLTSKALPWAYGPVHGGCITRKPDGKLLHFFNSRLNHRYHVGAAELSPEPPFDMLRISKSPILYGQEGAKLDDNPRFKKNVVFACGAIWENNHVLLSYGWNDCESRIVRLSDLKL